MSCTFTKLSSDIIHSSVWRESLATKITWVTMLAMADQYGRVGASTPGLATAAGVSLKQVETALACFLAPDPYSRTPDHEGRRIEKIDKGWRLLNYEKNRNEKDEEHQRKRNAERQARWRERQRNAESNGVTRYVTESNPIAEAEADSCGGGGGENSPYGASAPPQQPPAAAEASNLTKTFGGISPRIRQLADVLGQHLKITQDMDFTSIELKHIPVIEDAPEELVALTVKYVLFGKNDYWRELMMDENDGTGGLKLLIRAFAKISEQAKSRGSSTTPKRTLNAQRGAGKRKTQVNLKAESVVPRPEDLILEAEELL